MRLETFEIKNFKGLKDISISLGSFGSIIGENNVGKSTVLQALELFLGGSQIKDELLFCNRMCDQECSIELTGHFTDLTESECESIAVRGRMHEDKWIIKKLFWCETEESGKQNWKELYKSFSSEETVEGWPETDRSWNAFTDYLEPLATQAKTELGNPRVPNADAKNRIRELARTQHPEKIITTAPDWRDNPGGGGNWKSNANSILPVCIPVRAVHDATEESVSRDASTYGKLVNLIVERRMLQRPEVKQLQENLEAVMTLFRPGEGQAEEVKELQRKINDKLNAVIGGLVEIETTPPDVRPIILPNTTLTMREHEGAVLTRVKDQGHGLQRTLIMSLLQLLAEEQAKPSEGQDQDVDNIESRSVILLVEEPELYMHPQMARKMRDALLKLSQQPNMQALCTTHSPVFITLETEHTGIIRMFKDENGQTSIFQPATNLYDGFTDQEEKDRLKLLGRFDATVNEVFFAKRVAVLEEQSAEWAFERAAELTGLFERFPNVKRDVSIVVVDGSGNITALQRALNHFSIGYLVMPDKNVNNALEVENITKIEALAANHGTVFCIVPNLEGLLGSAACSKDKPYKAIKEVERLHAAGGLPASFLEAMNMLYLGSETEPPTL